MAVMGVAHMGVTMLERLVAVLMGMPEGEIRREEAIKLWAQKRQQGWRACGPQWSPPQPPRA